MRFLTLCLIGFVFFTYDISKFTTGDRLRGCLSGAMYKGMNMRHYILGGIAFTECYDTSLTKHLYLTINGKNVTKKGLEIRMKSSRLTYHTNLTRSTKLGEYWLHGVNKSVLLFRIGYILCDPTQVAPPKVCGKGQFCVINGSSTNCQQRLDCESSNGPMVECKNGKSLRKGNSLCSGYNNAKSIPQDYYLRYSFEGTGCEIDPRVFYKGQSVQYLSTIPVSGSRDLDQGVLNATSSNTTCLIQGRDSHATPFDLSSNPNTTWPEIMPSKKSIVCLIYGMMSIESATIFHILFYDESVRFFIVQKKTNTMVDVTNLTKPELWLDSSHSYYCNVLVSGGLFVKALHTEGNSPGEPHFGEDNVKLEYRNEQKALHTCWAIVYFYEQIADQGFKELYRQKREIIILSNTTSSKGPSQAVVVGGATAAALLTLGLLVGAGVGVRTYRKRGDQSKKVQANIPFRSVRAPATDHFKSMTTDRSASVVSASRLQPTQGSDLISLFYKQKPKSGKRTGSHGIGSSHRRRSSKGVETAMPKTTRRGTGPIGLKLESLERAGSHETTSSHRRRSSQRTDTGSRKFAERRAGSIEPKYGSASDI